MLAPASTHEIPADHPCARCSIRQRTFCGVLDAEELRRFRHEGSVGTLQAREPLFHQGDPADVVFSLTSGTLKLYKLLPDGRRQVAGFLYPGDFLGLAVNDEHAFSAESIEPIEFCRFTRARFDAFVDEHAAMERELYRIAAHELASAREQMVLLGRKTAAERLASFLLFLRRKQRRGSECVTIDLPMNRTDIADYLGLTKETISRVFTQLKTSQVIRLLADDQVLIRDLDRLTAIAAGEALVQ